MDTEVRIDKRTKAYKDRVKLEGESMPAGNDIPLSSDQKGCHRCGKQEDLIEVSPNISICRSCASEPIPKCSQSMPSAEPSVTGISPDTPPEFSKAENNPGFTKCMHCGCDLEYNDDGSPKRRVQPELCHACTWRNNK